MAASPDAKTSAATADPESTHTDDRSAFNYISPPAPERPIRASTMGFQAVNAPAVMASSTAQPARNPTDSPAPTSPTPSTSNQKARKPKPTTESMRTRMRELRPAPPRKQPQFFSSSQSPGTCFYDLPAELRIEIYRLALENVYVHILPEASATRPNPLPLIRTSHQIRSEVLPLMHSMCEIQVTVTDFNFEALLTWLARIPPDQESMLTKNPGLKIRLVTSPKMGTLRGESLRKWLHLRADPFRPQAQWKYSGPMPKSGTANTLKRRVKRMTEVGKRREFEEMLKAVGVPL